MPVEERLRSTLVQAATDLRLEAEGPLERVRRRRTRRLTQLWAGVVATAVVGALGVSTLVTTAEQRPAPLAPSVDERADSSQRTIPPGTYSRQLTAEDALAAGFPPGEVRWLFGGGDRALAVMVFRRQLDPQTGLNAWRLWFVDEAGDRRIRDGGGHYYADDGELTVSSKWIECMGCTSHFTWDLERGRLSLTATPETQPRVVPALLEGGPWRQVRR